MSAPRYVPLPAQQVARSYQSPPWNPASWYPDRPGELRGRQPWGEGLGTPGPDPGYAMLLARQMIGELHLLEGEDPEDAVAGATVVALKRSAAFGRAPTSHDLRIAYAIWGFTDPDPAAELVELRRELFAECHSPHYYERLRRIADSVPVEVLHQPTEAVLAQVRSDWRSGIRVADEG